MIRVDLRAALGGGEGDMATRKQKQAARRNIKKAAAGARSKRTISKLPKRVRTALGKQANKVKRARGGR
jgi:hypothetical protein